MDTDYTIKVGADGGEGSSAGQDADSIMVQRVDSVGRASQYRWTGLAYSADSLKYKHLFMPMLDTTGTPRTSSGKLYDDGADGKIKIATDANTGGGSGGGQLDTVRQSWGLGPHP